MAQEEQETYGQEHVSNAFLSMFGRHGQRHDVGVGSRSKSIPPFRDSRK